MAKYSDTTSSVCDEPISAHIFTDTPPEWFYKQAPGATNTVDGVKLSIGMDIPPNIDVLLLYTQSSYSVSTRLPRERTVFITGEPEVIHPYNTRFLNQFGIVLTASEKEIATEKLQQNNCARWFVGVDFSKPFNQENLKGYDWLINLKPPPKLDKISVVTSNKTYTTYHRRRLKFIDELKSMIPEHLDIFGHGLQMVDDKADAILPYRYHLALENGAGRFTWSEKLSDPLLCYAFPFYAGCENVEEDLPNNCFAYVDLDDPEGSAEMMVNCLQNRQWRNSLDAIIEARELLLHKYNLVFLFACLAKTAMARPVSSASFGKRLIRSERSLWPDKGGRGSMGEWMLRSVLLYLDPTIEMKVLLPWRKRVWARRLKKQRRFANEQHKSELIVS